MYSADAFEIVRGERFIESVVRMRRNEYASARYADDDR